MDAISLPNYIQNISLIVFKVDVELYGEILGNAVLHAKGSRRLKSPGTL